MTAIIQHTPLDSLIAIGLRGISKEHTRRAYRREIAKFIDWTQGRPFTRATVIEYRTSMTGMGSSSINLALSAIRRFALELHEEGLLDGAVYASIDRTEGVPTQTKRLGQWLDDDGFSRLVRGLPPGENPNRCLRDHAALLVGVTCGLRRDELVSLRVDQFTLRNGRSVLADIKGKRDKIRTVGVHASVTPVIQRWIDRIAGDWLFPTVAVPDTVVDRPMTGDAFHDTCLRWGKALGLTFAPHDLRRTFALQAYQRGAEIEDISRALGHSNAATTALYMRDPLALASSATDKLVIEEIPTW